MVSGFFRMTSHRRVHFTFVGIGCHFSCLAVAGTATPYKPYLQRRNTPRIEHGAEYGTMAEIEENSVGIVKTETIRLIEQAEPLELACGKTLAPVTKQLPYDWHNSLNIHFLSLKDFDEFCKKLGVKIEKRIPLIKTRLIPVKFTPNLFAEQAIYVTSKD